MKHNRITINQAFAKSNREGKDELLRFFAELREIQKDCVFTAEGLIEEIVKE